MNRVLFPEKALAMTAALFVISLGLAACNSDSLSSADREAMVTDLTSDGLTEDEANCFIDELGGDAKRLWEGAEDDSEVADDDFAKLLSAFIECAEE